jgi:hypothetical protein
LRLELVVMLFNNLLHDVHYLVHSGTLWEVVGILFQAWGVSWSIQYQDSNTCSFLDCRLESLETFLNRYTWFWYAGYAIFRFCFGMQFPISFLEVPSWFLQRFDGWNLESYVCHNGSILTFPEVIKRLQCSLEWLAFWSCDPA